MNTRKCLTVGHEDREASHGIQVGPYEESLVCEECESELDASTPRWKLEPK